MKLVRSVAYAVIVLCAILCIVIAFYASREKKAGEEGTGTAGSGQETESSEYEPLNPPNLADLIVDRTSSAGDSKPSISGNLTGEITYDEIVRLQNEDLDREFRIVISDYNKKYGIVTSTPTTTSSTAAGKDYKYFVNKETKIVHRIDCLLKPVNSADTLYYETLTDAAKAGYTSRCPVCSP